MNNIPSKINCLILLLVTTFTFGVQSQNLVPNPSFEDYTSCPTGISQMSVLVDWYQPAPGTSDYLNACYAGPLGPGVPLNVWGFQEALTGNGYCGMYSHNPQPTGREYIQVLLTEPLIAGECYELEMYANPADVDWLGKGISDIGIYLSEDPPPVSPNDGNIYVTPQVFYQDAVVNTNVWTPLNGIYTAAGGEQYLTIGNFSAQGSYIVETINPQGLDFAYYYVEDVRVELISGSGQEDIEATICEGECYEYDNIQYCSPGVYNVTPQSSCFASAVLTITEETFAIAEIENPLILDCNNTPIVLDASGSSSGPEISYLWSGPNNFTSTVQNPEVIDPGTYTLIVDGTNLCPAEATIQVSQDISEPDISTEVIGEIDCNNQVVILNGYSISPNATFQWNGPGINTNSPNINTSQEGIFILTVTGENGCTSTEEVNIVGDLEAPDIFAEVSNVIDCNNPIVILTGNSNSPNVTYHWSGPGLDTNLPVVNTSAAGIYTFTVAGENGCVSMQEVNVLTDIEIPDIFAEASGTIDCNNSAVVLSGGSNTPNTTYFWSGPGVNTDEPVTSTNQPGVYTFEVFALNGCMNTTIVVVVEENTVLDISAAVNDILDCENLTVTLTGQTNEPNVTYQWIGPGLLEFTPIVEVDQAGEYTFSILTASGCSADTSVLVEQNTLPPEIIISTPDTLNCISTAVVADASNSSGVGSLNFEWQDQDENILGDEAILNIDSAGNYVLILTDEENGCSDSSTVEVIQDTLSPIADAGSEGILTCDLSEATLDGSNSTGDNLAFQWLDQNDVIVDSQAVTQVTQPGNYTIIITNQENGCTASASVDVTPDANLPTAIIDLDGVLNCQNMEAILDGSNSSSVNNNTAFEWLDELGNSISVAEQITVSNPGVYTLVITDAENGCTQSAQVEVIQDVENPVADAGPEGVLTCDLSEATLDGSNSTGSNLAFQWFDQNNVLLDNQAITQVSQAGTYSLIITNQDNGCTDSASVDVTPDANLPTAIINLNGVLNCQNLEAVLDGSNSSSVNNNTAFEWLDELGNSISMAEQITVSSPGFYTLVITDAENGCTQSAQVEVIQDVENPVADAGPDGILTCDNSQATLDGSNSTGDNLAFQWFDQNNVLLDNQSVTQVTLPGTYILIITNQENGCTASATTTVTPDANLPTAIIDLNEVLNCLNTEATLDGSNSSSVNNNIAFEWLDELGNSISMDEQITVSSPGFYTLIITDIENGCTQSAQVEVIQDVQTPVADAGPDGILTCDNSLATLDGSNSTGDNLAFQWFDQNNVLLDNQANTQVTLPGTYTLIITDQDNGCTASASAIVTPDANLPTAIIDLNGVLNCQNMEAVLDGSNSSSVNNNTAFEWLDELGSSISMAEQITVSNPGFYTLVITDVENGCTQSAQLEVMEDIQNPVADAGPDGILTCDNSLLHWMAPIQAATISLFNGMIKTIHLLTIKLLHRLHSLELIL